MIESVSKRAFSGSSGTYNVHALELAAARDFKKLKELEITVRFLDESERTFNIDKHSKGAELLEQVYQHLELIEKDYFGLQIIDDDRLRWLDPSKSVKKQTARINNTLYFRVKFYVSDPSKLQEEYTRYQFCLQIRRNILDGRLILPPSSAILLASYTVQAELGDYQPDEHDEHYISHLQLLPGQNGDMEAKIAELHKAHKGQMPAQAEFKFLDHAKQIDMYGVELYRAKDKHNKDIHLGVTYNGLVVFQNNIKINTFSWSKIMKISFKRKHFYIQLRREQSENYDTLLGFNMEAYKSSKNLWKACVEHHTFFRLYSPKVKRKFPFTLGSKFSYSGRTEFQTVSEVQQRGKLERKFVRSPSKQLIQPVEIKRRFDHKVQALGTKEPRKAWLDDERDEEDDGGFLERTLEGPFQPGISNRMLSYADEETTSSPNGGLYDTPPYSTASHSPTSQIFEDNAAVTITLYPDAERRYGFNVKGGTREDVPIVVSRVGPNTPADRCVPRLTEGDHLIAINGTDVTHAFHIDVVQLIQTARGLNDGKLVLVVRQSTGLSGGEENEEEEPPFHYVPAGGELQHSPGNALEQSMLLLADGLANGALIANYELLYRKHPDLTCDVSLEAKNVDKNRYRDILPYDTTRVLLTDDEYINANYVNMKINGSEVINRYIATQGPLESTNLDFWRMIIEQKCELIIMLTTLLEKGRTKCYKYWPNVGESMQVSDEIKVECCSEAIDKSWITRGLIVKIGVEVREVVHLQYLAWPDHGVPDSPGQFLQFTQEVRERRVALGDSMVVVHCSAGIGRTGVLVLMETGLCLMEAGEPIYPLEIVRCMRQQRAMMIQNASQYKFVCESVHSAYMEHVQLHKDV